MPVRAVVRALMRALMSSIMVKDLIAIIFANAFSQVAFRSSNEIAWICLQDVEVVLVEVEAAINNLRHLVRQDPQSGRFVELRKREKVGEKNKKFWLKCTFWSVFYKFV